MHYDFVRIRKTLRMPPAMKAGLSPRLWRMDQNLPQIEAREEGPKRPMVYKTRISN
jgi:hypothetical protein